jgi:hypothetical protein
LFLLNLIHYNLFAEGEILIIMFLLPGANKMIKAITFIFFFVIVVFILSDCKKDNQTPRSYPRLRNTLVSDITEKGARFSADLYSIGTEKIIEHGFVWGTTDPNIYYSDRIQLGTCDTPGIYSAYIASTLKKDLKYTVKSYVQTADHLVYGIPTDFKSLGSSAPVIYDFYPHSPGWLDTLTIKGKNFSWVSAENVVSLNQTECSVLSATDTVLKVLISSDLPDLKSVVSVGLAGNIAVNTRDTFKLIEPYTISSIKPKEGTWGTILTVMGNFHPTPSRNVIRVGGYVTPIIAFSKDSIKVAVPQNLIEHNDLVVYTCSPFTIISQDTFKLFGPRIDSITPIAGVSNSTVSIRGNYFLRGNNFPQVKFGSINATITGITPTKIDFSVPYPMNNGPVIITVTVGSQSKVFEKPFLVINPVITKVYPLTGTFNDEVTIEGENLSINASNMSVFFAAGSSLRVANILTASSNKVVVKVPPDMDSIPRKINLHYYPNYINFISSENFVLNPPVITSVTPSIITTSGQDIVISGSNFLINPFSNEVYWDIYPLTIKSGNGSAIVVTLPASMPRINGNIILKAGGYKRIFPITNQVKSYWGRIAVPSSFIWEPGAGYNHEGIAFSIDNLGYMMEYNTGNMSSFNPITNEFQNLGNFSAFRQASGMSVAVNRDTAYLIAGSRGFFRYDVVGNKWISIGTAPAPVTDGVAFTLNNKLYFGLSYTYSSNTLTKELWCYDFTRMVWTLKNNLPNFMTGAAEAFFTIENKEYVVLADSKLWQYDPTSDVWLELAPYPRPLPWIGNNVAFVIDNKAYVGPGGGSTDVFLRYDPLTNVWTEFTSMPGGKRGGAISFVVNNKAYLGFGIIGSGVARDFYEFDPNYPF